MKDNGPGPDISVVLFRHPTPADAQAMRRIVADSGVLDGNSLYLYILLCDHFRNTCLVAQQHGRVVGFVTAYIRPDAPGTLFVWQVGVEPAARGQGIARSLLLRLAAAPACGACAYVQATVSPENAPSRKLFASLACALSAPLTESQGYGPDLFYPDVHPTEPLLQIGPVAPGGRSATFIHQGGPHDFRAS